MSELGTPWIAFTGSALPKPAAAYLFTNPSLTSERGALMEHPFKTMIWFFGFLLGLSGILFLVLFMTFYQLLDVPLEKLIRDGNMWILYQTAFMASVGASSLIQSNVLSRNSGHQTRALCFWIVGVGIIVLAIFQITPLIPT